MKQTMKKKWKLYVATGLGVLVLLFFAYVYYPRKIIGLLPQDFNNHSISILGITGKGVTYQLNKEQVQELEKVFAFYKVRRKVFQKKYEKSIGFGRVLIEGTKEEILFFTESDLSVNNVQYKVYGAKKMVAEIEEILKKATKIEQE